MTNCGPNSRIRIGALRQEVEVATNHAGDVGTSGIGSIETRRAGSRMIEGVEGDLCPGVE